MADADGASAFREEDVEVYGDGFFAMQPPGKAAPVPEPAEPATPSPAAARENAQPELPPEKEHTKPKQRKRFVGTGRATNPSQPDGAIEDSTALAIPNKPSSTSTRVASTIPASILQDPQLKAAIALLPSNYNFEIHKSIHALRSANATRVALQFPEGLLMYACTISDILSAFANVECVILGDVTYGACCVDDYTAVAAGCDFLIHYGHSCLVPVSVTKIKALYVFVDIQVDLEHFVETMKLNFVDEKTGKGGRVVLVATIQFIASLQVG